MERTYAHTRIAGDFGRVELRLPILINVSIMITFGALFFSSCKFATINIYFIDKRPPIAGVYLTAHLISSSLIQKFMSLALRSMPIDSKLNDMRNSQN